MAVTRNWREIIDDMNLESISYETLKRAQMFNQLVKKKGFVGTSTDDAGRRSAIVNFLAGGTGNVGVNYVPTTSEIQQATGKKGIVQSYSKLDFSIKITEEDYRDIKNNDKLAKQVGFDIYTNITEQMQKISNTIEDLFVNTAVVLNVTSIANVATGILAVDRPEKVRIGDMYMLAAPTASSTKNLKVFVIAVNKNTKQVTFSDSLGGSAYNLTNYVGSTAAGTKVCVMGTVDSAGAATGLDGFRSVLLSAANGGASSYLGLTKTAYPFLQAVNIDASTWTASDLLPKIFEAWSLEIDYQLKTFRGKKANSLKVSPKIFVALMNSLEQHKGSFRKNDDSTLKMYDANNFSIASAETGGVLNFERVPSFADDVMVLANMDSWQLVQDQDLAFNRDLGAKGEGGYVWYQDRQTGQAGGMNYILDGHGKMQTVCGCPEANAIFFGLSI